MKATNLTSVNLEKGGDIAALRQIALTLTEAMRFTSFERTRTVTAAIVSTLPLAIAVACFPERCLWHPPRRAQGQRSATSR